MLQLGNRSAATSSFLQTSNGGTTSAFLIWLTRLGPEPDLAALAGLEKGERDGDLGEFSDTTFKIDFEFVRGCRRLLDIGAFSTALAGLRFKFKFEIEGSCDAPPEPLEIGRMTCMVDFKTPVSPDRSRSCARTDM